MQNPHGNDRFGDIARGKAATNLTAKNAKNAEREPEFLTAKYAEYAKRGRNLEFYEGVPSKILTGMIDFKMGRRNQFNRKERKERREGTRILNREIRGIR